MTLETLSEHGCFGGVQGFYRHDSEVIGLQMRFSVFRPPQAATEPVPVLYWLAGLTCTEETFMIKAGAQRRAAELGIMLVACDTSPRSTGVDGATGDWEFGEGAGFYLDATQAPWSRYFRMNRYVGGELRELVESRFPVNGRRGIFGHSMGGHGALTLALRHPELYRSVSAFAPICAPADCPWGQKAFSRYFGEERAQWNAHDASRMMLARGSALVDEILIDQGLADKFLHAGQLLPERFEQACAAAGQPLQLRRHDGYDHGYYFIASFIDDHLDWHHARLRA
jgi:S-formylglutathione hydrolase